MKDINKVKIVVNIPDGYLDIVRNAILDEGAGVIGNYTHCSSVTHIVGTFKPNQNATPFLGKNGKMEYVKEDRLEVQCDIKYVRKVLNKIREVHPYEEVSIDLIPLLDEKDIYQKRK